MDGWMDGWMDNRHTPGIERSVYVCGCMQMNKGMNTHMHKNTCVHMNGCRGEQYNELIVR